MSVIFGIISQTNIQLPSLVLIKHFEKFPSLFGATFFGTIFFAQMPKKIKILKKWLHYSFGFFGGKRLQIFHPKKEITYSTWILVWTHFLKTNFTFLTGLETCNHINVKSLLDYLCNIKNIWEGWGGGAQT